MAAQLDTRIEIVTPENIAFEYRVAGPFRRLAAYLIDLVIRIVVLMLGAFVLMLSLGLAGLPGLGGGLSAILYFALDWFYGGLLEALFNGQTPGKHLLRIRVVSIDGQPISGWQAILRNLLRSADAMPLVFLFPMYQLGLLTMAINNRFQRLGDLVSGTMVVIEERQRLFGVARVTDAEAIRLAGYLPANFPVSRSLARTLSTYVERRLGFLPARRAEIARHLGEPLRERFNLPVGTSHDLLLCALYHLAFIAHRPGAEAGESPFSPGVIDRTPMQTPPVQLAMSGSPGPSSNTR